MKAVIFLVICGIFSTQANGDGNEMMKKALETCAKELTLTADETKMVQAAHSGHALEATAPRNVQCFTLCFFKQLGLMTKDDKLDEANMEKYLAMFFKDQGKAKEVLKQCWTDAGGKDACEKSYNFEVCLRSKKA